MGGISVVYLYRWLPMSYMHKSPYIFPWGNRWLFENNVVTLQRNEHSTAKMLVFGKELMGKLCQIIKNNNI